MEKISIVIPVYNEKNTLLQILDKVEKASTLGLKKELILIDDNSTDGSRQILEGFEQKHKIIYHKKNLGKGTAVRKGFQAATGDIVLIQDADLEYDPNDYPKLIEPFLKQKANVVYGSRYQKRNTAIYTSNYLGVRIITWLTNLFYGSNLTDAHTCYKAFRLPVLKSISLVGKRFEIDQEITIKILKGGYKIIEVPINYHPRTFAEGKKIDAWSAGLKAIWLIIKYKFSS